MTPKQWAAFSKRFLKKRLLQRARALLDQVAKTYSQDPLWAEQWMEIGQVFLKGAVLALERSETAPSCHDES